MNLNSLFQFADFAVSYDPLVVKLVNRTPNTNQSYELFAVSVLRGVMKIQLLNSFKTVVFQRKSLREVTLPASRKFDPRVLSLSIQRLDRVQIALQFDRFNFSDESLVDVGEERTDHIEHRVTEANEIGSKDPFLRKAKQCVATVTDECCDERKEDYFVNKRPTKL